MSPEDRDDWERYVDASIDRERQMYAAEERARQAPYRLTAGDWGWITLWSAITFIIAVITLVPWK